MNLLKNILGRISNDVSQFMINEKLFSELIFPNEVVKSVCNNIESFSPNLIVGNCCDYDVKIRDLLCLSPDVWLNDTIMNIGFALIQEKCLSFGFDIDIVSTHWYTTYTVSVNKNYGLILRSEISKLNSSRRVSIKEVEDALAQLIFEKIYTFQ